MRIEQETIAAKYAEAVLDLAQDLPGMTFEKVLNDLQEVNKTINETKDLSLVLNHPAIAAQEKKKLLNDLFGSTIHELTMRMLDLMTDKRRLNILKEVEFEYRKLARARQNIISANLISAETLDEPSVESIKKKLAEKLGKQVDLHVSVDKSLIAGAILRLGDQILDGSVKGKLASLEKALVPG